VAPTDSCRPYVPNREPLRKAFFYYRWVVAIQGKVQAPEQNELTRGQSSLLATALGVTFIFGS
jgi:hypothetical protein